MPVSPLWGAPAVQVSPVRLRLGVAPSPLGSPLMRRGWAGVPLSRRGWLLWVVAAVVGGPGRERATTRTGREVTGDGALADDDGDGRAGE